MSVAALTLGGDHPASRQAVALSLSVTLHLTLGIFIFVVAQRKPIEPPIEISIFEEGPRGPASPPPGPKSPEPGPIEAPKAVEAPKPKVARAKPVPRPAPAPVPVENQGLLAALKRTGPLPKTQAFEGVESSVRLRERPAEAQATTGTLGTARARADVRVSSEVVSSGGPAVSGSLGSGVGSVVLPGPGGGGSGWGADGASDGGGGGRGRGGFSVSGAGAGGAGRSYASIWNWTQRYLAGLRYSYNNELRTIPTLRGVLLVRYQILASGDVSDVAMLSSGLHDPRLEQEVLRQIRGWKYPPEPTGTVVVTWPFSFLPPS